jgi:hypothetical protein
LGGWIRSLIVSTPVTEVRMKVYWFDWVVAENSIHASIAVLPEVAKAITVLRTI